MIDFDKRSLGFNDETLQQWVKCPQTASKRPLRNPGVT